MLMENSVVCQELLCFLTSSACSDLVTNFILRYFTKVKTVPFNL